MFETPLHVSEALTPDQFEGAMLVLNVLKVLIGSIIAYIAYRGYRRNRSRPMLYLSLGFVLVLVVPFFLFVGAIALVVLVGVPSTAEAAVVVASEVSQLLGLIAVVYALRI